MAEKSALIVDDSATARIMLAKVLQSMDVATKHAKSGEEALTLLKLDHPDLIFLDHLMPGMDGFQTLKAIKSNPETQSIPVVMYTSQNALKYREEAKALGAAGVITKQLDREQLYLLVEKIWMQHEAASVEPARHLAESTSTDTRSKVVELRPAAPRNTPEESEHIAAPQAGSGSQERLEQQLQKMQQQSRAEAGRYKNILILLLAAFCIYAIVSLQKQNTQVRQLESQIEENRRVMQEMIDIIERSQ